MAGDEVDAAAADRARLWVALEAHRARLLRVSRRRTATAQDAEDCVQEALLRAMEFPNLDESRLGPFLTTVTVRLCADRYRERNNEARLLQRMGVGVTTVAGPEDDVCERHEAEWLAATFSRLPKRQQQVVRAREAGLSCSEAASHLEMSYVSVESSLARARARFRAVLARAGCTPLFWSAARADVAAIGAAGAFALGVLLTMPAATPPVPMPEAAAAPHAVVPVAPRPTVAPAPAPTPARFIARAAAIPVPALKKPSPSPSPSPSMVFETPVAGHEVGVGTDGSGHNPSQVERLEWCIKYGVQLDPVSCRYPPD